MPITKPTKTYTFANGVGNTADATEVNENFDILYAKDGEIIDALNDAAGTKNDLSLRLAVSMNDDGTMKSPLTAGGEWINPGLESTYISGTQFSVVDDHTDIYLVGRRLKIVLAGGTVYTAVAAASYATGITTVTVGDVLTDPITSVEHGVIGPVVASTSLPVGVPTGITATAAELNVLDGIPGTLTAAEIGYLDGVTSAIQTQLDAKAATASFAASLTANGYQKLPGGLILQWGAITIGASTTGNFTFPITFPNAVFKVFDAATQNTGDGDSGLYSGYTTSGGTIRNNFAGSISANFFAIGY